MPSAGQGWQAQLWAQDELLGIDQGLVHGKRFFLAPGFWVSPHETSIALETMICDINLQS